MREMKRRWSAAARAATAAAAVIVMAAIGAAADVTAMAAEPATRIGAAETVVRDVRGVLAEERRTVATTDPVYRQEKIETGTDSMATLRFFDDTTLTTGANSTVTLNEFVYAGGTERAAVSVGKGIMRFVTGSMASSAYQIKTPTAIIGVRGTAFAVGLSPGGDQMDLVKCERGTIIVNLETGTEIQISEGQCVAFDRVSPATGRACTPAEQERAAEIAAQQKVNGQGDKQDFVAAAANTKANNTARELTGADEASCTGC